MAEGTNSLGRYTCSGLAPALAAVFTNPLDVARVRMQLQNELMAAGSKRVFLNAFHCMYLTAKAEGWRGLQRGLVVAFFRESSQNIPRLGLFAPLVTSISGISFLATSPSLSSSSSAEAPFFLPRVLAGMCCGIAGAVTSNPFEILKARMQAYSPIGLVSSTQHEYKGVLQGLSSIIRAEGVTGLFKGVQASMVRCCIGTSSNLVAYSYAQDWTKANGYGGFIVDGACGLFSGIVLSVFMNPIDTVRTRLYNQPFDVHGKGTLYSGITNAIAQIYKKEGATAFYKGFTSQALRQGPHMLFTFAFLGWLTRLTQSL